MWCMLSCDCCSLWYMLSCSSWSCTAFSLSQITFEVLRLKIYFKIFSSTAWHKDELLDFPSWPMQQDLLHLMTEALELCHLPCPSTPFQEIELSCNSHMWKFSPENLLILPEASSVNTTLLSMITKHTKKLTQVQLLDFLQVWGLDSHNYYRHNTLKQ